MDQCSHQCLTSYYSSFGHRIWSARFHCHQQDAACTAVISRARRMKCMALLVWISLCFLGQTRQHRCCIVIHSWAGALDCEHQVNLANKLLLCLFQLGIYSNCIYIISYLEFLSLHHPLYMGIWTICTKAVSDFKQFSKLSGHSSTSVSRSSTYKYKESRIEVM